MKKIFEAAGTDLLAVESDKIAGYFVNAKEIEMRVDRYIYKNGSILSKVFRNNRLCMVNMVKSKNQEILEA